MSTITAKSIAKYALLPGIIPRLKALFGSGFGSVAYLMAHVYNMVRLLPNNHPYLDKKNIGQFGIRHVIAQAANNLVIRKENWDQLIIFIVLLVGIVLLFAQVLLIIIAMLFEPVLAQAATTPGFSGSIFVTPDPITPGATHSTDIAFLLLDRVFGIPDFFCTANHVCTDVLSGGRWPFHVALHSMLEFYSNGILIIAVIIFLYFIVVVVGETATSGTPFGERFQNIWVPIRLVVALGLLTPLAYGLNTGQYIGLFLAKTGSSLATNGWNTFNKALCTTGDGSQDCSRTNPTGESNTLLALPAEPDIAPLVQFMSLVHGCAYSYWRQESVGKVEIPKELRDLDDLGGVPPDPAFDIKPYFVRNNVLQSQGGTSAGNMVVEYDTPYNEALDFYNNSDITIVFGRDVSGQGKSYTGNIEPTCGEISVKTSDLSFRGSPSEMSDIQQNGGSAYIQNFYYNLVLQMWFGEERIGSTGSYQAADPLLGSISAQNPAPDPLLSNISAQNPTTDPLSNNISAPSPSNTMSVEEENALYGIDDSTTFELAPLEVTADSWTEEDEAAYQAANGFGGATASNIGTGSNQRLLQHLSQRFAETQLTPLGSDSEAEAGSLLRCKIGCDNTELPSCKKNGNEGYPCKNTMPDKSTIISQLVAQYQSYVATEIKTAWHLYNTVGIKNTMRPEIMDRGWAGAAIWYNTISQINGSFINAVFGTPAAIKMPKVMEEVKAVKTKEDSNVSGLNQYEPKTSKNEVIKVSDNKIALALYELFRFWNTNSGSVQNEDKGLDGNPIIDAMNIIFGTHGIFTLRGENAHIHPLAQLSAVGKGIVNSSIINLGAASGISILGGPLASFNETIIGPLASFSAELFSTTAFIGMTAGVVLFYILPLQPFIFFFFAVAGWVKGLFEAMVGIPLWALGHMRIDGEGLPGDAATNGYFLLFELFLRPILIVFGLIAATIIFSAQVRTLNFIWDMVVDNVGGIEQTSTLMDIASEDGQIHNYKEAVLDANGNPKTKTEIVLGADGQPQTKTEYIQDASGNLVSQQVVVTKETPIYNILETAPASKNTAFSRGIIDQFFFTILYTIILYMLATASFKLIDNIPDTIMRWAGNSVSAFGEADKNPAEGLQRYAATGGMVQGQKLLQAGTQVSKQGGTILKNLISGESKPTPPGVS